MANRQQLLKAHIELTAAIRASEPWEESYTKSPKTFKRLVRHEARLQAAANEYLLELRERAPQLVNWSEAGLQPLQAAAVPPASDEAWKKEAAYLTVAIGDHIVELLLDGANAGEDLYSVPLGYDSLHEAVVEAAGKLTAERVTLINQSTRRKIQLAIKQSIARGEDVSAAWARVQQHVSNPVRAEMIAQTESVNAYQAGLDLFGEQSGVKSWTWDALMGACELCAPLDGVTRKVGQMFTLGNGDEVARPAAHPRCRCGRIANY